MSVFVLKLIAMATMLIDHIGYRFAGNLLWMRVIGRTTFILYAFLMAESYYHLRGKPERLKFHIVKLLILCLVSEIPYDMFFEGNWIVFSAQSVLPTLTLGFLALTLSGELIRNLSDRKGAAIAISAALCVLLAGISYLIRSDYSFFGVLLVVLFYLYRQRADTLGPGGRIASLAGVFFVYYLLYTWVHAGFGGWTSFLTTVGLYRWWYLGMLIPFFPIALYDRQLGYHSRWFNAVYSLFYPVHMLVLFLILRFVL